MSASKDITRTVSRIWRMYKRQESLLLIAMRMDIPCKLRRHLGKGRVMSSLFKKEIHDLYESVKSISDDGDLASITRSADDFVDQMTQSDLIALITAEQNPMVNHYNTLLEYFDENSPQARLCKEHIEMISKLNQGLSQEAVTLEQKPTERFVSVA